MTILTLDVLAAMIGSSLSGVFSRILCHPLDTLKARVQASSPPSGAPGGGVFPVLRTLLRAEGVLGLYRGFGVAVLGGVPASCLYFTTYEVAKARLGEGLGGALPPAARHFAAGMAAEAVSCVLYVPVDVVKERLQVRALRGGAGGAGGAAEFVLRGEGLRGLYRGYWATVGSFGPFSAIYFTLYEALRGRALAATAAAAAAPPPPQPPPPPPPHLPAWLQAAVAGAAGAGASLLTNPLDLVKLRLQVWRAGGGAGAAGAPYRGLWDGLRRVAREEGARGLLRGAPVRMAFHAASTCVSMSLYEEFKAAARRLL
jgi:hypothetical protein